MVASEMEKWLITIILIVGGSLFFYFGIKLIDKMSPIERPFGKCGEV